MAKAKGAALAKDEPQNVQAGLALAGGSALGSLLDFDPALFEETGLEEVDATDIRIASWGFNKTKKNPETGRPYNKDEFVNSITGETRTVLRLALIDMKKTREWADYDAASGVTEVHCKSWDSQTGTMTDGRTRQCKGCPDFEWKKDANGKPKRNCTEVQVVLAEDRDDRQPVIVRFKSTALKPWRNYFNHTFLNKVIGNRRVTLPLFIAESTVKLELIEKGGNTWAEPRFEVASDEQGQIVPFSADELRYYKETLRAYRELHGDDVRRAAERAGADEGEAPSEGGSGGGGGADDFSDDGVDYRNAGNAPADPERPNAF